MRGRMLLRRGLLAWLANVVGNESSLWQTARPPSGRAGRLGFDSPLLAHRPCFSSRLPLTLRSSGRATGGFAARSSPLTSTLDPIGSSSSPQPNENANATSADPRSRALRLSEPVGLVEIELYRHAGYIGRSAPLDILVNGGKFASVAAGQTLSLSLPGQSITLQVAMQGAVSSQVVFVQEQRGAMRFECGNPLWVLFDFLSLCHLPGIKGHVFFLRQVNGSSRGVV